MLHNFTSQDLIAPATNASVDDQVELWQLQATPVPPLRAKMARVTVTIVMLGLARLILLCVMAGAVLAIPPHCNTSDVKAGDPVTPDAASESLVDRVGQHSQHATEHNDRPQNQAADFVPQTPLETNADADPRQLGEDWSSFMRWASSSYPRRGPGAAALSRWLCCRDNFKGTETNPITSLLHIPFSNPKLVELTVQRRWGFKRCGGR